MNTKHLTLTLAVAAAAALTSLTGNAAEPFLSPRAKENQIRTVPGITENRLPRGLQWGSPKEREMAPKHAQTPYVSDGRRERNLVTENRDVAASPRALETFPWLAQRGAAR